MAHKISSTAYPPVCVLLGLEWCVLKALLLLLLLQLVGAPTVNATRESRAQLFTHENLFWSVRRRRKKRPSSIQHTEKSRSRSFVACFLHQFVYPLHKIQNSFPLHSVILDNPACSVPKLLHKIWNCFWCWLKHVQQRQQYRHRRDINYDRQNENQKLGKFQQALQKITAHELQ